MVTINLVCVGGLKEKYFVDAVSEYSKRLSRFCKLNIIEVSEHKTNEKTNDSVVNLIKEKESQKIIEKLAGFVVLLEVGGQAISSENLAQNFEKWAMQTSTITFVIGGSFGVSDELKKRADYLLSFSKFTFPHQLMRVFLLEQVYRAFTINNNIVYHK